MSEERFQKVLSEHQKWLNHEGGKRADLSSSDLRDANLSNANLSNANLKKANLYAANLSNANLSNTNLSEANLGNADLRGAYLYKTNLAGADLRYTNLRMAEFIGAVLRNADLRDADMRGTNLAGSDLRNVNLSDVNLEGAELYNVNLEGADLTDTNIRWANFAEANLKEIKNFPYPDLYLLKKVIGKIQAYELVGPSYENIFRGINKNKKLIFEFGKTIEVRSFDTDERKLYATGINVATLNWCQKHKENYNYKILEVEFTAKDIVAIPYATDGRFRVKKCKVIREVSGKGE